MKPEDRIFSFQERAAAKSEARMRDEAQLQSGQVLAGEMARINGGSVRRARYVGPSKRFKDLALS